MTHTRFPKRLTKLAIQAIESSRFVAVVMLAAFALAAMQPAHAQSSDTWKSVAIIGGSTAAGAIIGHKIGGSTGAVVGAGVGATVGYSIDRRRRQNEYNQYGYNDGGYYPNDGGYYPNDGGYYGGYGNGGPYDGTAYPYPYPSGYQSNSYRSTRSSRRR